MCKMCVCLQDKLVMNELAELFELMCDMQKREWQVMVLRVNFIILS